MSEDIKQLLKGKFTPIENMTQEQLVEEVKMWRNIWSWVPSGVKYYVSRVGQQIGVQVRNYKRYIGILLDTEWDLKSIEIGTYDKVYDQTSGQHYYERKITRLPVGQIVALDWIAERIPEKEMLEKIKEEQESEEQEENLNV